MDIRAAADRQFQRRYLIGGVAVFGLMAVLIIALITVQVVRAPAIQAAAAKQRVVTEPLIAVRGAIVDRNGKPLAYTDDARSLTFQPKVERAAIEKAHQQDPSQPAVDQRLGDIAADIHNQLVGQLGDEVNVDAIRAKLNSNDDFVYLVRNISPDVATEITTKFPEVGAERQSVRIYPNGPVGANIVGVVGSDGNGLMGLESAFDSQLAGVNGSQTYDRGSDGAIIPGSLRNVQPAKNGATIHLTIDADVQWYVQNQLQLAKQRSGAKSGMVVVMDSRTGEVLAMANDGTFDPSRPLNVQQGAQFDDTPVTSPFEPGSVNKIVTASAAIQYGLTNPNEVLQVPGSITMSGVTVNDAWVHSTAPYTTTGIFGMSSNVGTLMLAQRVGEKRFADMLNRFGLGQRTNIGLPGESAGQVLPLSQWGGGSFANFPIGQGISMTLLQMTAMYQAIANNGLRIPPRIITNTDLPGTVPAKPVQVVDAKTATTVRNMFRAVLQNDPTGEQQGTGYKGAIAGYQLSGKTGTAQQVDPRCGCYSNSSYNITFAGIAPADNPRFVVGIMLDNPKRSTDGSGGDSAAPLFQTIGSWLLQREQVPFSPRPAPKLTLRLAG